MQIESLWHELTNEGYTQVWLFDGPSPNDGSRIVALLDEYGGEIARRTDTSDAGSWKMAGINSLKGFNELPKETLPIVLSGAQNDDKFALIMAESAGRPQQMEKPFFYR